MDDKQREELRRKLQQTSEGFDKAGDVFQRLAAFGLSLGGHMTFGLLHLVVGVFTCGLWLIVTIPLHLIFAAVCLWRQGNNMLGKVYPGQFLQPLPAWIQNELIDMALANRRRVYGAPQPAAAIPTDRVMLENNTGGNLAEGRVLEIGAKIPTTLDKSHLWFGGETPAPDGADVFAITSRQMPADAIEPCYVTGIVPCRLNVNHVQQTWADVDSSSTLLQSKWHGRAKIIWKSTASTGEQDALIQLGHDFRGPINVVATSGITADSSASCAVYWAHAAASPSATITCYLNWMHGGANVAAGAEAQVWWHPDQQKYIVGAVEC